MSYTAAPTVAGIAAAQRIAASGLSAPPAPSYYTESGWQQVPPAALQVASMTGSPAGGAPGASYGPPGTANAPVTTSGGFSTPMLVVAALAIAGVLYLITKKGSA